ncbi:MAG: NAD(+)/NADH kinase [Deltaproteobacteria bacterium]|nr:NAD(+)/NADH kinase [Deltaproteobacteria bacterium]
MQNFNVTVILKKIAPNPRHQSTHLESIARVEEALSKRNIFYQITSRHSRNNISSANLIVTVGGDGTFLHASHLALNGQILMGINSVPQASHGEYCVSDAQGFPAILDQFLSGKSKITEVYRLQAKIKNRTLPVLALNDILFCHPCPAGTTRYQIEVDHQKEEQKCSGVWISTATGSTAATHSAGGKILSKEDPHFQFVVREPFSTKKNTLRLTHGVLAPHQTLKLSPHMPKAMVFIDGSHHAFSMNEGEVLSIGVSKKKLKMVI